MDAWNCYHHGSQPFFVANGLVAERLRLAFAGLDDEDRADILDKLALIDRIVHPGR